jgi:LytS/YehU family sensor histidine kinase
MQALSSQMNPHFIFNCMNSIQHSIITNDTEKASTMLHDFASLIRMVLENSSQPDITLENEIKLLETYLKLEQIRTNNSFDYKIDVESSMSADFINIPTMMLQPFLENAIWHGFKLINYIGLYKFHFLCWITALFALLLIMALDE